MKKECGECNTHLAQAMSYQKEVEHLRFILNKIKYLLQLGGTIKSYMTKGSSSTFADGKTIDHKDVNNKAIKLLEEVK